MGPLIHLLTFVLLFFKIRNLVVKLDLISRIEKLVIVVKLTNSCWRN